MLITPIMNATIRAAAIAGLALACHSAAAAPITWDAAADFYATDAANTKGVWSYGFTSTGLYGDFNKFDATGTSGPYYKYWTTAGLKPSLGKAVGGAFGGAASVPANTINMHPGPNNGEYSVLRFLAKNDGQYTIDVDFWANHGTTTDVHVLADGVEQFSTFINTSKTYANPSNWVSTVTLSAGDYISFMVGKGGLASTWNSDSTGIAALISFTAPVTPPSGTTPEPSGLLLMASGLGLAAFARRRKPI